MRLFNHEKPYDRDKDGHLDAGEFAQWEMGNQRSSAQVTLSFSVSGPSKELEEDEMEHPSPVYARTAIARGALADPEEIELCEVILWDTYPQLHDLFDLNDLPSWRKMIKPFLQNQPELAVAMWQTLLDCAQPVLSTDEETAMELCTIFIEDEWIKTKDAFHLMPFVNTLKQGRLAVQMFRCAYVGGVQLALLKACCAMGEIATAKECLHLLMSSPYPQSSWHMPLRRYREILQNYD